MRNRWNVVGIALLALLTACVPQARQHGRTDVDSLNSRAYALRYVDIDRSAALAQEALSLSSDYPDGENEARCNLSFVKYQQMDFDGVDSILRVVEGNCSNPLLLLCADVMHMKVTQRTGQGEAFFHAKSKAESRMKKLERSESTFSPHEMAIWVYAQSEFHIISSTYYFYQEQDDLARAELAEVLPCLQQHVDTAQWVYYNYMLGPGGLVEGRDARDITLQEFDYLFRSYITSRRDSMRYFEANNLQAMATMFLNNDSLIAQERNDDYNLLLIQHRDWLDEDENLPLAFARHALYLFKSYNDLFQTACAYRTLGEVYFQQLDYEQALDSYMKALHCVNIHHLRYYGNISPDTLSTFNPDDVGRSVEKEWIENPKVLTVPEWISGIRQQLSLVYSAMDMKQASDYNRNSYLDLLLATNQDLELENRAEELERQTRALYGRMLLCIVLLVVALLMVVFFRRRLLRRSSNSLRELSDNRWEPYVEFQHWTKDEIEKLEEEKEELEERLQMTLRSVADNKRKNAENRAKVSLVHGIVPFLDRIGGEVLRMRKSGVVGEERREYIIELVDQIEQYNALLTEWIQMQQGQLNLHISTFPLDQLFKIVSEGHFSFDQKGVRLKVQPISSLVKADESLTLFMINTLADNARKFTPAGGSVTLSAEEAEEYVEVRVTDTGCGLTEEEVDILNNSKIYDTTKIGQGQEGKGFGFGLMNCRGIIEKYKKVSSLFSCCTFGVRSRVGEGSTFFFRLPRVVRLLVILFFCSHDSIAQVPATYYDSLYNANLQGSYHDAVRYASHFVQLLNGEHPDLPPIELLDTSDSHREPAELLWAYEGVEADYEMIVGLRNEMALAALALGDWELYHYNNRACIRLYKFIHRDNELPTYFSRLRHTHRNSNILLVVILLTSLLILFFAYRLLVSNQVSRRREILLLKQYLMSLMDIARRRPRLAEFQQAAAKVPGMQHWADAYYNHIAEESVVPLNTLSDDISRLADEQARMDFEQNRLYVQNQILDNCLSTIKHESMYYPSRIRILAEQMKDSDIQQLAELVQYYRHVYSLLCRQADAQVSQPGFRRQDVSLDDISSRVQAIFKRVCRQQKIEAELGVESNLSLNTTVLADAALLDILFENLLREMMHAGASFRLLFSVDGNFMRFTLRDQSLTYDEETLSNVFFPESGHIPYLIAKQILREHDTYCNHPGCRLVAQKTADGEGYEIYFTLLLSQSPKHEIKS